MAPDQSSGLLRQSESNGPTHEQKLGGVFQSSPVDKDLGILVHEKLVMNNQCALAAQKFSCILGCIQSHVCSSGIFTNIATRDMPGLVMPLLLDQRRQLRYFHLRDTSG